MQGILLSYIYDRFRRPGPPWRQGLWFALVIGGYHWTIHVLAEAAKHDIAPLSTWFALETAYLATQFAVAMLIMAYIYGALPEKGSHES